MHREREREANEPNTEDQKARGKGLMNPKIKEGRRKEREKRRMENVRCTYYTHEVHEENMSKERLINSYFINAKKGPNTKSFC